MLYKALAGHNLGSIFVPKKLEMQADGTWNNPVLFTEMLCGILGALHDPDKLNGDVPTFQYGIGTSSSANGLQASQERVHCAPAKTGSPKAHGHSRRRIDITPRKRPPLALPLDTTRPY